MTGPSTSRTAEGGCAVAKFTLIDDAPAERAPVRAGGKFVLLDDAPSTEWSGTAGRYERPGGVVEDVVRSIPGAVPRAAAGLVGLPQTVLELIGRGVEKVGGLPAGGMAPTLPNVGGLVTKGYDKISEMVTGEPVYRPQTGPGRVADMTAQMVVGGPGSIAQKATMGAAAGATGEGARMAGVENPIALGVLQLLGATAGGLPWILRNVPAANINDAIKNIKPQDLDAAQVLMDDAARMGAPITGAEAIAQTTGKNTLQDIQRVVEASRKGGPVLQQTMNERPQAARTAFETRADQIAPMPTEPARTPPRMQAAAETAIQDARRQRTEAASPFYQQQRSIDAAAVQAERQIPALEGKVQAARSTQAHAMSDYGRFKEFENFADQAAQNWYPVQGQPRVPGRISNFPERAAEGAAAAAEAKALGKARMQTIPLAEADLGAAQQTVQAARTTINEIKSLSDKVLDDIAVVGANSTEGKILRRFYNEIAPKGNPLEYASRVESAYKANRDRITLPDFGATAIEKTTAGVLGPYVRRLDEVVTQSSPHIRAGRDIYKNISRNVIDPLEQSPVGDIARTKNLPAESAMRQQSEILMPQAPRALDPKTIRKTVDTIKLQDPTAARDWVRQNLQAVFDESAQNLSAGANQWGGAKFAAQVVGNPRQKENLRALVESVSDRQTWVGFNRMLEVLEAQGKRQAPGSQTAFNQKIQGDLASGGAATPLAAMASPSKAMGMIGQAYDDFRYGKNAEEMAKILTDPRSVEKMRALAKEAPTSARAAMLTAELLAFQQPGSVAPPSTPDR